MKNEKLAAVDALIRAAAREAHEANRRYCISIGDDSQPPWEDAPDWQKKSAMAGAEAIYVDPSTTPRQSHEGWLKIKKRAGWIYGEVKDPAAKTHPCMVPYDKLPDEQRKKDSIFGETVRAVLFQAQEGPSEPKLRVRHPGIAQAADGEAYTDEAVAKSHAESEEKAKLQAEAATSRAEACEQIIKAAEVAKTEIDSIDHPVDLEAVAENTLRIMKSSQKLMDELITVAGPLIVDSVIGARIRSVKSKGYGEVVRSELELVRKELHAKFRKYAEENLVAKEKDKTTETPSPEEG